MDSSSVVLPDIGFSITDYLLQVCLLVGDNMKIIVQLFLVLAIILMGVKVFRDSVG